MFLSFSGHNERYAIEQMLFILFPREILSDAESENNKLLVTLENIHSTLTATATLHRDGGIYSHTSTVPALPNSDDSVQLTRQRRRLLQSTTYLACVKYLNEEPAWGMLSGVRPVKIPTKAILEGTSLEQARRILENDFHVTPERAQMAMDCAVATIDVKSSLKDNELSLYIGIPFCPTRCNYCSFISSVPHNNSFMEPYLILLHEEIKTAGRAMHEHGLIARAIYIGGGTPTTLSPAQLHNLMEAIHTHIPLKAQLEYTVEAGRPDTITQEKLSVLKSWNCNRISINPQTMQDTVLASIGRNHTANDILSAFDLAREMGFSCINMDLIAGLPGDDISGFKQTLDTILSLSPEHITVHTLAIKRGSHLSKLLDILEDKKTLNAMLDYASTKLRKEGYTPYYLYRQKRSSGAFENIGWGKFQEVNEYNICMMEELHHVLSLGAGGISKIVSYEHGRITRLANPKYPHDYIAQGAKIMQEKERFCSLCKEV